MIAIIDYGMGNIHSVQKALETLGASVSVVTTVEEIKKAEKLVLPGVGAFADAMEELETKKLTGALCQEINKGKPFLGICLGMQLLFESSQEAGRKKGLGIIKGGVLRFADKPGRKVPHMGWNSLYLKQKGCPLFKGIEEGAYVYFCHSYYGSPSDKTTVAATTDYGQKFASIVWRDNLYGVQFHPEKSQATGITILKNFVEL